MPYSIQAPQRINGRSAVIQIFGNADDAPPGFADYQHYLDSWEVLDPNGKPVENCAVAMSFQHGSTPAYQGIDGKPYVIYTPAFLNLTLPERTGWGGDYTFRCTMIQVGFGQPLESGGKQTLEAPMVLTQTPLATYSLPAIPGLQAWEDHMVEVADKWAPQILDPDNQLGEGNWYYDIGSTYFQIGDYLKKSNRYIDAALASLGHYEEYLLSAQPPGAAAGWCIFPRGLRQAFERTQEKHWVDTMALLRNAAWVGHAGSPDPGMMRETAYSCDYWREMTWIDGGDPAMLQKSVDYLLNQIDLLYLQELGKGEGVVNEPFMFGLLAQSLIDCYDMTADERIPGALAIGTRYIWDHGTDQKTGYVMYDLWTPGGVNHDNEVAYTGLNPMLYNAWGFLYQTTGDDLYRQQGDILFEHQFDDQGYAWSPKQFAQCYRRSIDYVTRWRA